MRRSDRTTMGGMESKMPKKTPWSLILRAQTQDSTRLKLAQENLAQAYWKPVYCYFQRRDFQNEEAKDLAQDFFMEYFLQGKLLKHTDKKEGSFRKLLYTALKRYTINHLRDASRRIRKPEGGLIHLSALEGGQFTLPDSEATPEQAFEHGWIANLLAQILAETQEQCCESSLAVHWKIFHHRVLAPIINNADDIPIEKICQMYNLETKDKASNMIVTVKRRFQMNLWRRLRDLTGSDGKAEEEFKEIMLFLSEKSAR